ncbi:hypothetical protein SP38_44 [Salmonella phage 38]|uniref:Uncharacterized protein n=1 Tax=Salmonella phage 38 TaxID=1654891 RepID=A0A0N7CD73_9CAUD|nr:hypothetical protein SP38_44 [Salmonella phage 38]AKJ73646.1 hypothetical protein SP38_44 [Salmonella phage 38]
MSLPQRVHNVASKGNKVPVGNIIVPTVFPDFRSANRRGRMRKFRQIDGEVVHW